MKRMRLWFAQPRTPEWTRHRNYENILNWKATCYRCPEGNNAALDQSDRAAHCLKCHVQCPMWFKLPKAFRVLSHVFLLCFQIEAALNFVSKFTDLIFKIFFLYLIAAFQTEKKSACIFISENLLVCLFLEFQDLFGWHFRMVIELCHFRTC